MMVRPDIQIQTMIKSMKEVVLPAVDSSDAMAQEQAQVIVGTLMLLQENLPRQFRYDCDELQRLTKFADELAHAATGGVTTAEATASLTTAAAESRDVLDRAQADPTEVLDAVHRMRATAAAVVDTVHSDEVAAPSRDAVDKSVITMSEEQLQRERAFVLMQGFENDPSTLTPIDELIGSVPSGKGNR